MAGRGSGIGMGNLGGMGAGGPGPSTTSTRSAAPGQLYGAKVKGGNAMGTHHWLWILVLLELSVLVLLRKVVFKSYHGG